jgi:hypothetical protein
MPLRRWVLHGKQAASQAKTFVSSPMGRCGVLPNRRCSRMSNAEKPTGACAWCMEPAFAVVIPVRGSEHCQWNGNATAKPCQVSVLLHPLPVGPAPLLWRDWRRREHRRACLQLVRHQRIEMSLSPSAAASPPTAEVILSRAKRAHVRLCWQARLARNARPPADGQVTITLFGVPEAFATLLGLRAP